MKILLVSPCKDPTIRRPRNLLLPQLALQILEGLTPAEHDVEVAIEDIEPLDLDTECDLVGITCMTANARRAYDIAAEFRKRGRQVVMGGVHPTMMPDEALQFADSVVVGEAEDLWEGLLHDVENRKLKPKYHRPMPALDRYVPVRHRRIPGNLFNLVPIVTTRGCPYHCDFCSVLSVFGRKLRHHPIGNVLRSIRESGARRIIFLDDNVVGDKHYSRELFERIAPLGIKWVGQASISMADDPELVRLAARSGCTGLFVGLESISVGERRRLQKLTTDTRKLERGIRTIRESGIQFHPSFVFGLDHDTKNVFDDTLDFLRRNQVGTADFFALTPYPGTDLYRRLVDENRLLSRDWNKYDTISVNFRPKGMSPEELQLGLARTKHQFNRHSAILSRLPHNLANPLAFLAVSLGYRKSFRRHVKAGKYGIDPKALRRLSSVQTQD